MENERTKQGLSAVCEGCQEGVTICPCYSPTSPKSESKKRKSPEADTRQQQHQHKKPKRNAPVSAVSEGGEHKSDEEYEPTSLSIEPQTPDSAQICVKYLLQRESIAYASCDWS